MLNLILTGLALSLFVILLVFAIRRLVFLFTLLRPQSPRIGTLRGQLTTYPSAAWPTVLLLVPARNESASLPSLCEALDALDYPRDQLRVVLINDGSTDDTGARLAAVAQSRPNWRVCSLAKNVGKAQALNVALAADDFGEIIYILDADHRPAPDCLRLIAAAFAEARVAGVSGQMRVGNATASPAAFYAAVESLVHQLITMRGKDVLGLGPALLGSNNAYRRSALAEVGGFRAGAFLEDSDLTLALHCSGYITRYLPRAVSVHHAPTRLAGYIKQHLRWGRGFNDVARTHLGAVLADKRLRWPMRVELALFALGYLDRLALLGAAGLSLIMLITRQTQGLFVLELGVAFGLGLPLMQIVAALVYAHAPITLWARLPLVPVFFVLDAGVAAYAALVTLLNRPRIWYQTERA